MISPQSAEARVDPQYFQNKKNKETTAKSQAVDCLGHCLGHCL